jgi:hypothetical protein
VLELVILPAIVVARREWVALELHPQGVVVTRRSGTSRLIPFGQLRLVRLGIGTTRQFQYGTLELDVGEKAPLVLREPMSHPLPAIASLLVWHMRVPLDDRWSRRDP